MSHQNIRLDETYPAQDHSVNPFQPEPIFKASTSSLIPFLLQFALHKVENDHM